MREKRRGHGAAAAAQQRRRVGPPVAMKESLLGAEKDAKVGGVRRASAGNLLENPDDVEASVVSVRKGSLDPRVDIEDALDNIGGLGRYQFRHLLILNLFWAINVGTPISVFANSPWCTAEGEPALCLQGDDVVPKSPDVYWSECRSLACQFNLQPALCTGDLDLDGESCGLLEDATGCISETNDCEFLPDSGRTSWRPLFDSSYFLGWMWSVPLFGALADAKGRRWALFGSFIVLQISTVAAALAPNETFYLIARHFNGVGYGSQSLSAYVLGCELAPRKSATFVKTWWAVASSVGNIAVALSLRSLLFLPGYNWRLLSLLSMAPTFLLGIVAFFAIDESPRWVLLKRGEVEAKQCLRKIALRNDNGGAKYIPALDAMSLRVPAKTKHAEAAYQMFLTKGLIWRITAICMLWFSAGFSFYGLTLGVNSLPFDRYYLTAIIGCAEIPVRALNQPLLGSALGRKYGILLLLSLLASASITAMFWSTDFGRTFLNISGRAVSGASFIAIYVWSTELLPTSVRQGGMSLGSFSARVGSVAAPWAAEIGALLPVPENLANDVSLLLFGASAIIAAALALLVLPETKNKPSPETIVDAVAQMEGLLANANKRAHQVAALLGAALSIGVSYLLATIVAADGVADNVWAGVGAGVALAAVMVGLIVMCYYLNYIKKAAGGISSLAAAKAASLGVPRR